MLKFNIIDNSILHTLSKLQDATETISTLLSDIDRFDEQSAEDISMLFSKREIMLSDFISW